MAIHGGIEMSKIIVFVSMLFLTIGCSSFGNKQITWVEGCASGIAVQGMYQSRQQPSREQVLLVIQMCHGLWEHRKELINIENLPPKPVRFEPQVQQPKPTNQGLFI